MVKIKEFLKERIGTIIFLTIVVVLVAVGIYRINKARQNAITYTDDYEVPEATANLLDAGEYVSIFKNDKLELFYNDVKGAIQIKNLENGHLWKSIVDEEVYEKLNKQSKLWTAIMNSAISIKYNNLKKKDSAVVEAYAAKDCGYLESEYLPNGVAVTYGFLTPGIYITVEYTIEDDELVVRVPYEKIREEFRFAVSSISILPWLGACGNENPGYLFYPDGSGAVSTFEKVPERTSNPMLARFYTYTHQSVSIANLVNTDNYNRYTASMPVCGLKNGDDAVFSYATKGAENSFISVYTSGVTVPVNRINIDLQTRNVYTVDMYSISTGTDSKATGGIMQRVDKKLIPEDKEVRYRFLSGDKANYSGMAEVYREYLLKNDLVKKSDDTTAQLALTLLMGTKKEGIVFDEYIPMTTYAQVVEILEKLKGDGIEDINVVLEGWQSNPEKYQNWGPDGHLGGAAGLKKVSEYADQNKNLNIFLQTPLILATSETPGLDAEDDVAYNGLLTEIASENPDGVVTFLRNALALTKKNEELLKKLKKYDGVGLAYSDLGKITFPDFNVKHSFTKAENVTQVLKALSETESYNRMIAVNGSNQYVLSKSDYLYNVREDCYGLAITDYAVPFQQMVLSGLVPYASENAGNLSYDLQTQKLQWVEFGSLPFFYLTKESALNLRGSDNDLIFSSTFEDWENVVVETVKEFKERLSGVSGKQIVKHEVLGDKLKRLTYENGTMVYVNYDVKDAVYDGVTIPAKEYLVIGGGN
ncbi:MAG: hypothetical protein J6U10_07455 [Lachnospiraceae bacterium]|nr:hypothetical protein [Lachnospiraceae bacterium]